MKIIIYALIALAGWSYYQKNIAPKQAESTIEPYSYESKPAPSARQNITQPQTTYNAESSQNFSCDGRQYCSQMHSRDEAEYFLRNCPNTKMDGDHDGIPCENDSRF